jgi:FlaA1/EpsC-like NDP-sugar epimerase
MTIPKATERVIQSGSMGQGGDVFVLDRVFRTKNPGTGATDDQDCGLDIKDDNNPDSNIENRIAGLRPGEKQVSGNYVVPETRQGGSVSDANPWKK